MPGPLIQILTDAYGIPEAEARDIADRVMTNAPVRPIGPGGFSPPQLIPQDVNKRAYQIATKGKIGVGDLAGLSEADFAYIMGQQMRLRELAEAEARAEAADAGVPPNLGDRPIHFRPQDVVKERDLLAKKQPTLRYNPEDAEKWGALNEYVNTYGWTPELVQQFPNHYKLMEGMAGALDLTRRQTLGNWDPSAMRSR